MADKQFQIGLVIVTHGYIGEEMKRAVEFILKEKVKLQVVSVPDSEDIQKNEQLIEQAIQVAKQKEGVLLFVDLYGSTPANLCCKFLKPGEVELLGGVNLPMLLKACSCRQAYSLHAFVEFLQDYTRQRLPALQRKE